MKTPTQAGQAEAARRCPSVHGEFELRQAFALACDELLATIGLNIAALDREHEALTKLEVKNAELATAKAALGQIARLLKHTLSFHMLPSPSNDALMEAHGIAAPYAVVTDPLVAVFDAMSSFLLTGADEITSRFRAELAKRCITIPEAGQ